MDGDNKQGLADQRLPSFQGPRDLKLSLPTSRVAAPGRRTFQPNIRAAPRDRNARTSDNKGQAGHASANSAQAGPSGNRQREHRKREPPQLVQTSGVFGEGIGSSGIGSKSRSSIPSAGGSSFKRSTSGVGGDRKKEIKTERKEMKHYGEGFIADLPQEGEGEYLAPMTIPFIQDTERSVGRDSRTSMEVDTVQKSGVGGFAEILSKSGDEGTVILLQLPEHLPLLQDEHEDTKGGQVLSSGIKDFPAGLLGTTEILSSGLTRLTIGDNSFTLEPGTQPSFHQELVYVTDDSMISLGPVRRKFLCTADVDSFLSQSS